MYAKQRRFADDGWAIWINGDDTSTVYINDWLDPMGESYIDLAVRIRGVKESKSVNIYVPFLVTKEEIEDVSLYFKDESVLRATFSSSCIIDFKKNLCTSEVAYNGRTIDIIHISAIEYQLKELNSGSLITIDLEGIQAYLDNDEAYLLFRMPHKSLDDIFQADLNIGNVLTRLRNLIMTPIIYKKYGYSVRINESRLLPKEINKIGAFHRQKLKKAVVTISINEGYKLNDSSCYRIRRLEEALYHGYVPATFETEDVITYQWNQNREINLRGHFNFYFELANESISSASMLIYTIIVLLLSAGGNALWDLVKLLYHLC